MQDTRWEPTWADFAIDVVRVRLRSDDTVDAALAACRGQDDGALVLIDGGPKAPGAWYVLKARDLVDDLRSAATSARLSDVLDDAYLPAPVIDGTLAPPEARALPERALVVVDGIPWLLLGRRAGPRRGLSKDMGFRFFSAEPLPRKRSTVAPPGAHSAWLEAARAQDIHFREAALPEAAPPPPQGARSTPPEEAPDTDVLWWNTTFPHDAAVKEARALFAGVTYVLRTWLGVGRAPGSVGDAGGDVSFDKLSPTGAPVDVSFRIEAIGAGVRERGSSGPFLGTLEREPKPCVKGKGTEPFDVELRATGPDRVKLTLLLNVRNATIQVSTIDLDVVARGAQAGDGEPSGTVSLSRVAGTREALARVVVHSNNGKYEIETQLGATAARSPQAAASPASDIVAILDDARLALDRLSNRSYTPSGDGFALRDSADVMRSFMTIGRKLHATLFGESDRDGADLRAMARAIAARGKRKETPGRAPRLQVDAELLPIPWGLLYDGDEQAPPDPDGFWGMRFQIDRLVRVPPSATVDPSNALRFSARDSVQWVIDTSLDADQGVKVLDEQRAFFARHQGSAAVTSHADFKAVLQRNEPLSLLYFFCHAVSEGADVYGQPPSIEGAKLTIEATPISIQEMVAVRKKPLEGGPLVFLNACGSAKGHPAFQSPFVQHFIQRWAARGVVGTEWEVPTTFADLFARRALEKLLDGGRPLGDAFHEVLVEAMQQGNPFGLIYALYAAPEIEALRP